MPVIYGRCISAQDECPTMKDVPFENCFEMRIDIKYTNRKKQPNKKADPSSKIRTASPKYYINWLLVWPETEQNFDQPSGKPRIYYGTL